MPEQLEPKTFAERFSRWLLEQRSSTRLTFVSQTICRIGFSLLSFLWTPLLLSSMGAGLNGLFLNFQKWASLGNLGDLGMGTAINIQTNRLLGQQKNDDLKNFLASARTVFLFMSVLAGIIFIIISPHLFKQLKFGENPQTGGLLLLGLVGGIAIAMVVLNSYITNLNYGCGNILWPVIPTFVFLQLGIFGHWLLARQHTALWLQYIPYICSALLIQAMGWFYLKKSHAELGTLSPLRFDRRQFLSLFSSSIWVYLGSIGSGIWVTTDLFLITAYFGLAGAAMVPTYVFNNKLCDLASFVANSAGTASTPKITQWLVSSDTALRSRGVSELLRLCKFQTFLCCSAAIIYLFVNDWFMGLWLGKEFQAPLLWQSAFAIYLAVFGTYFGAGEMGMRCCEGGIRVSGITSLVAALLNLGLSIVAVLLSPKIGMTASIFGIAFATVIAQSSQLLFMSRFTSQRLKISWWQLFGKIWFLAWGTVIFAIGLRYLIPPTHITNILWLVVILPASFVFIAWMLGIGIKDLQKEKEIFLGMFGK